MTLLPGFIKIILAKTAPPGEIMQSELAKIRAWFWKNLSPRSNLAKPYS